MAKSSAKAPAKTAAPKAPKIAAPAASPDSETDTADAQDSVQAGKPAKNHVVHFCYDNEHADGVHCTLTFDDGTEAVGTAPSTGALADDQAAAAANALASAE